MCIEDVCAIRNWSAFDGDASVNGTCVAHDLAAELQQQVLAALERGIALNIAGNRTKGFYGMPAAGRALPVSAHRGIVHYEPTELIVTARAGTTLDELESVLAREGQMLGFEPPYFGCDATLGGTIACGFSGPRRPFAGSARDFVLGCRLINGRGEIVSFGGEVMKNVAGFDVSRLMVGAMGTLGVLLEISLKVLPQPAAETSLALEATPENAHSAMLRWASTPLPISALAYDGRLRVRLSGAESAVVAARRQLGGEVEDVPSAFWTDLREHRLPFFQTEENLWRLSLPPAAPRAWIEGAWLLDWGGAQRWLRTSAAPAEVFAAARQLGGHATLFRSARPEFRFQPLPANLLALHQRVKRAFDPHRLFNVGRLGAW
jgi:glycolate oxidase FAD binding subunit